MEAELFHADGQAVEETVMTMLTVAFRRFANAPKNSNLAILIYF